MSDVEDLVAQFLELREEEPELDPLEFVSKHPASSVELGAAIDHVLDTLHRFANVSPGTHTPGGKRLIGGYELLRELGRGGMGVVFEARRADDPHGESVALKVLPFGGLFGDRVQSRFQREVRILERLDHPQIVSVREFGTEGDSPFLVMDLIRGQALSERVGTLSPMSAATLIASLARTVQAAHDQGVLHRDIKPQNVIVTPEDTPVLLDFGLVAACDEASITSSGDLLGTPRYMSPEQARGEAATERSDVHALGLLLYELVAGRPAFEQQDRSALLKAVSRSQRFDPRRLHPRPPTDLLIVLQRSLAWNPLRRYASAGALAQDLERFARGEHVHARAPGPMSRAIDRVARRPMGTALYVLGLALALSLILGVLLPALETSRLGRAQRSASAFDRAVALESSGRTAWCLRALDEALEVDPGNASALALRARVRNEPGPRTEQGAPAAILEGIALEAEGHDAAARERFRAALALDPDSPWAVTRLASSARRAGDLVTAEAELVAGSQRLPNSLAVAQELAAVLYRRGEHARAEREYRRALDLCSTLPDLWQGLALCLFRLERNEEALDATRRALQLAEQLEPEMANTMAALLDRLGFHARAQEYLARLVEEHPASVVYNFNLAFSLDSDQRAAEAKPYYERVLELHPGHPKASVCLAWLLATIEDPALHDEARGEELLLEALERDRGLTPELVQGVQHFAGHTGRIERLADLVGRLAEEGQVDERSVRLSRAKRSLEELLEKRR